MDKGCIILRDCWHYVHAPTERLKVMITKDSFNKELEHVFDQFRKYGMKIFLGDFNTKVGREEISKQVIGNKCLHEINNDNGFRVVKFATSKI
jgi:dTDP-4-dehydrorhamnose reductase